MFLIIKNCLWNFSKHMPLFCFYIGLWWSSGSRLFYWLHKNTICHIFFQAVKDYLIASCCKQYIFQHMAQHIDEQHCYTTPAQPLKASYLVRIQVLEITSLHLFVNRHLQHSFSILSSSANKIQTKLHCKWETIKEIIKEKNHTVTIWKGFSHFENSIWSKILFGSFF